MVDLDRPHLTPCYDPYSHLSYAARAADVRHVMARGRWLLYDRRLPPWTGRRSPPGCARAAAAWPHSAGVLAALDLGANHIATIT